MADSFTSAIRGLEQAAKSLAAASDSLKQNSKIAIKDLIEKLPGGAGSSSGATGGSSDLVINIQNATINIQNATFAGGGGSGTVSGAGSPSSKNPRGGGFLGLGGISGAAGFFEWNTILNYAERAASTYSAGYGIGAQYSIGVGGLGLESNPYSIQSLQHRAAAQRYQAYSGSVGTITGGLIGGLVAGGLTGGVAAPAGAMIGASLGGMAGGVYGAQGAAEEEIKSSATEAMGRLSTSRWYARRFGIQDVGSYERQNQYAYNFRRMGMDQEGASIAAINAMASENELAQGFNTMTLGGTSGNQMNRLRSAIDYQMKTNGLNYQEATRFLQRTMVAENRLGTSAFATAIGREDYGSYIAGRLQTGGGLVAGLEAGLSLEDMVALGANRDSAVSAIREKAIVGLGITQAGAGLSISTSKVRGTIASGAGYQEIGRGIDTQVTATRASISALRAEEARLMPAVSRGGVDGIAAARALAQVQSEIANQEASIQESIKGKTQIEIQQRSGVMSSQASIATTFARASYAGGDFAGFASGMRGSAAQYMRMASGLEEMSNLPNLSPSERAELRSQAMGARASGAIEIPKSFLDTRLSVQMGQIGVMEQGVQLGQTYAGLFGNSADIYRSTLASREPLIASNRAIQERLNSGLTDPRQRSELEAQLISNMRQLVNITEQAARSFASMNIQVSQTSQQIAQGAMSAGVMRGAGGVGAVGMAGNVMQQTRQTIATINAEISRARGAGIAEDSPYMMSLKQQAQQQDVNLAASELQSANMPLEIGHRRQMSALNFSSQFLQAMPMGYGSLRRVYGQQIAGAQEEMGLVSRDEQELRRQMGGSLTPAQQEVFQTRMQNAGMIYANAFQQLSYGWQDRLISNMVNTPGNFGFASGQVSYRAAVGAGVRSPFFGAKGPQDVMSYISGSFLSDNMNPNNPAGFNRSALSGMSGISDRGFGFIGGSAIPSVADILSAPSQVGPYAPSSNMPLPGIDSMPNGGSMGQVPMVKLDGPITITGELTIKDDGRVDIRAMQKGSKTPYSQADSTLQIQRYTQGISGVQQ